MGSGAELQYLKEIADALKKLNIGASTVDASLVSALKSIAANSSRSSSGGSSEGGGGGSSTDGTVRRVNVVSDIPAISTSGGPVTVDGVIRLAFDSLNYIIPGKTRFETAERRANESYDILTGGTLATKEWVLEQIGGGGGGGDDPTPPGPDPRVPTVRYLDYDGTVVASFSPQEFLMELDHPANPVHSGLTAQGWDWQFSAAQTHVQTYNSLDIVQRYTTDDGKTRLTVVVDNAPDSDILIRFGCSSSGGVKINWGDGSAAEWSTSASATDYSHTYADGGTYTITLEVAQGETLNLIGCIMGSVSGHDGKLRQVSIGSGVTSIGSGAFQGCANLTSFTLPAEVTSLGAQAFDQCPGLTTVVLPNNITSIGVEAFRGCSGLTTMILPVGLTIIRNYMLSLCSALTAVEIPLGVTGIGEYAFSTTGLTAVTIPSGVTSIGAGAFNNCTALRQVHMKPTSPPAIQSNTFQSLSASCIIYVPQGSLSAYQGATNWSALGTRMQEE